MDPGQVEWQRGRQPGLMRPANGLPKPGSRSGPGARTGYAGTRSTGIHSSASAWVPSSDNRVAEISGPGRLR